MSMVFNTLAYVHLNVTISYYIDDEYSGEYTVPIGVVCDVPAPKVFAPIVGCPW